MALSKHHILVCLDADNILMADATELLVVRMNLGIHLEGFRCKGRDGGVTGRMGCTSHSSWELVVTTRTSTLQDSMAEHAPNPLSMSIDKLKSEIEFAFRVVHVFVFYVLKLKLGQCVPSCALLYVINIASDSGILIN